MPRWQNCLPRNYQKLNRYSLVQLRLTPISEPNGDLDTALEILAAGKAAPYAQHLREQLAHL